MVLFVLGVVLGVIVGLLGFLAWIVAGESRPPYVREPPEQMPHRGWYPAEDMERSRGTRDRLAGR